MTALRPVTGAALAALLLAVPATSLGQQKPIPLIGTSQPKARPAAAPKPAPAPEPTYLPAPAEEPAPIATDTSWRPDLSLGWEKDSDSEVKGPRVQVELERDLVALGRRGMLSFVGAIAYFRGSDSKSLSGGGYTLTTDITQNLFEVVPSFRFSFAPKPRLRLFAELGVGGGWFDLTTEQKTTPPVLPASSISADHTFGTLRLSAGGSWQVNDRLRVGVLLPTLSKRYSTTTSQTLSFSAMAAYAF